MSYSFTTEPTTLADAHDAVLAGWAKAIELSPQIATPEHDQLVTMQARAVEAIAGVVAAHAAAENPTVADTLYRIGCSGHANAGFEPREGWSLTHLGLTLSEVPAPADDSAEGA